MQSEIPKIKQESGSLSANALDIYSNAIILLPREESALKTLPYGGEIAQRRKRAGHKLDSGKPFATDLPNKSGTHIAVAGIDPQGSAFELLTLARRLAAAHGSLKPERIAVAFDESLESNFRNALYPAYKANREPAPEAFRSNCSRMLSISSRVAPPALAGGEVRTVRPR